MTRTTALLLALVLLPSAHAQREYGFDNTKPSGQPYLKPEESLARMKVADGFEIKLFAAEPMIVNPIAFTIDEKGRVWAIESFDYPKRTAKGAAPRDRIVILEDTDGDGVADKRTVFAEGKDFPMPFDLASGIEVGHGGVFVGAPPYLWFIENKNDKPGKFEVLLKGFGSDDTHETLNTFQWGPDGWLYGLHGVFTYSEVKPQQADGPGTRLNAGVWRYHPKTKKFEVFAEGTSNPWGMDWRNTDGEFILCCCVIPHLFHMVPGGIYKRQAGQSYNPYAYGEIKEICDHTFHKESGWAHAGLISLDAPHIPEQYRNSVIFGSIHGCSVKQNILKRNGSTFTASRGDDFLVSGDKNFRPINMKWGPAGDIYLSDWHDQNPCHQAKPDSWDYEHGRIYRLQVKGTKTQKVSDMNSERVSTLITLGTTSKNPWTMRTAIRILHERGKNPNEIRELPISANSEEGIQKSLRVLWILSRDKEVRELHSTKIIRDLWEGLPESRSGLRAWAVRIIADTPDLPQDTIDLFADLAAKELTSEARLEFASVAHRFGATRDVTSLLHACMKHDRDTYDPVIPFMIWLAYEPKLAASSKTELPWLAEHAPDNPLITDHIIPRAMRRLVATGKADDLAACVAFVADSKDAVRKRALAGLAEATKGRLYDAPAKWASVSAALSADADPDVRKLAKALAVSFRDPAAVKAALATAADSAKPQAERVEAVRALALLRPDDGLHLLLHLLKDQSNADLRTEAVRALGAYDNPAVADELLAGWKDFPPSLRAEVANVLAGRRDGARRLLDAVAAKTVARTDLTDNTILRIRAFNDRGLNDRIEQVWGKFRSTPKELAAVIDKMRNTLYEGGASFARGKAVFDQHCAKCHKFDGRGAEVGPPLDGAGRDIEYLLANVLDPNRVIGQPYFVHTIERRNGTTEIGVLAAEDDQTVTLKVENGVLKVIPKKDIETRSVQEKSMMPEGLGYSMTAQDFRDLVRYVMAHPFVTTARIGEKDVSVGPPGRLVLPAAKEPTAVVIRAKVTAPSAMKTRLQLGSSAALEVKLNGQTVYTGAPGSPGPDAASAAVELKAGENVLEITARTQGEGQAVYARFLDPDRKLRYPE